MTAGKAGVIGDVTSWRIHLAMDCQREAATFKQTLLDAAAGSQPALQRLKATPGTQGSPAVGGVHRRPVSAAVAACAQGAGAAAVAVVQRCVAAGAANPGDMFARHAKRNIDVVFRNGIEHICSVQPWLDALGEFATGGFKGAVRSFFTGFCSK